MKEAVRNAYGSCLTPGFLPCRRLFRSEVGVSSQLIDVLPQTVTLRRDMREVLSPDPPYPRTHTPFMEVGIVPFEEAMPEDVLELVRNPPDSQVIEDIRQAARGLFRLFFESIENSWDPSKFHLIWHSSGHDSRLISWAVKHLYEKNGPGWLGDVLFFEWDGESEPFKQIMQAEGWTNSQWTIYNPDALGTSEYHLDSFEFKYAWKRLNGQVPFPLAFFYDPVEYFQQQGIVPSDDRLQCWTGLFANELVKHTNKFGSLAMAIRKNTDNVVCMLYQKGDFVWPYLNLKWIAQKHKYREYREVFGRHQKQFVEILMPELTHIPRIDSKVMKRGPGRGLSRNILQRTVRDFEESWYGRNTHFTRPAKYRSQLRHSIRWGHWALASLCEHLLEQGYHLKVQEEK